MRIAFWNVNKNTKINTYIKDIISENNVDIMIMAEYEDNVDELLKLVGNDNLVMQKYMSSGCKRLVIIGNNNNVKPGFQEDYFSIQIVEDKYILCCVHLPSKVFSDEKKQIMVVRNIIEQISYMEEKYRSSNTIIVGDFNTNPYESVCLDADCFHGIPVFEEARRNKRKILNNDFSMFYNPMWNFFGDFSFPYGTYYYSGNEIANPFWDIYDQVLIRPSLRQMFIDKELKILHKTKKKTLLDVKRHPNKIISDHLPILFEIKEN